MKTNFFLKQTGIIYLGVLIGSLGFFYLESNRTTPSGLGVLFGPFNYYYLIYKFGVRGFGVFINVITLPALLVLNIAYSFWSRILFWILLSIFVVFWFSAGFFAHVYETEMPLY